MDNREIVESNALAIVIGPDPETLVAVRERAAEMVAQFGGRVEIASEEDAVLAGNLLVAVTEVIRTVDNLWKDAVDEGYKAHRKAISGRDETKGALPDIQTQLKKMVEAWEDKERIRKRREQLAQEEELRQAAERIRLENERRLLHEAVEAQEAADRLAAQAEQMAAAGDEEGAEALEARVDEHLAVAAQAEASAVEQATAPIVVPTLVAPYSPPARKAAGVSTTTQYVYEVTDIAKVPKDYLIVDDSIIGPMVRSSKGRCVIPGIRCYEKTGIAVRTKR